MGNGNNFWQNLWAKVRSIAKRVWEYLKVAKMEWIVMISLLAFDLATKAIVAATVDSRYPVVLIPGFLQINYTTNVGAAYGSQFLVDLLTPMGARIFYSVFAVAASVAFVLILIRNKGKSKIFRIGIAMFVAGAMGNCIDRMFLGYVRDFVHFSFQPYIFNIADAELIFGVVLIVVYLLFFYHSDERKKKKVQTLEKSDANGNAENNAEPAVANVDPDNGTEETAADGASVTADTENVDTPAVEVERGDAAEQAVPETEERTEDGE